MKLIIRLYYLIFHRKRCFKYMLFERTSNLPWSNVDFDDIYLDNNWWLKNKLR